jgi:hypothetical protein
MKKNLLLFQFLFVATSAFCQSLDWNVEASKPGANFYSIRNKYSVKMDKLYQKNATSNLLKKIATTLPNNNPESPMYDAIKYKRWEWFWSTRVNADGSFPSDIQKAKILNEVIDLDEKSKKNRVSSFVDSSFKANWVNISRIRNSGGYAGMGLTSTAAFHPTDKNTFWVSADIGGIWKTTDGGLTYTAIGDNLPYLGAGAIAVDRTNVDNIIMATGNGSTGGSYYAGYSTGIHRTTNGGASWNAVKGNLISDFVRYHTIVQDPTNASVFYACSNKDFLISTDAGASWNPRYAERTPSTDFEISPIDPAVCYAMFSGKLFKSTDGGANYTFVREFSTNTEIIIRIALSPSDINRLVVYTQALDNDSFIWGSTDGGVTWQKKAKLGGGPAGGYPNAEAMIFSPTNPDILYAGNPEILRSTDFGTSWTRITSYCCGQGPDFKNPGDGNRVEVHADTRNMEMHPITKEIFSFNDGGVDAYNETTNKWRRLSNGLVIPQYYSVASSETDVNIVNVGSQDNGGSRRNSDGSWVNTNGGDASTQVIDPTDASIYYTHYNPEPEIIRTTDDFQTTESVKPSDVNGGNWVLPFVLKSGSPKTIFVGYQAVYRSDNRGDTWVKVSPNLTSNNYEFIRHIAVARTNANYIYASDWDKLYKTRTGNTSGWTSVKRNAPITGIAIKDNDPSTVYISQGGYLAGNKVFKSTDGGNTFTNISAGIPNIVVSDIVYQGNSAGHLYIATDFGVYYKTDSMATWAKYGNGMPNVVVNQLSIQYSAGKLRAATYGRGVYETDLLDGFGPLPPLPVPDFPNGIYTIENRKSRLLMSIAEGSTDDNAPIVQLNSNGTNSQKYEVKALGAGEYSIKPSHSLSLNKSIDVPNGSLDDVQIVQNTYTSSTSQKWKIIPTTDDFYQIKNVKSTKSLGVDAASTVSGAKIFQFPYSGSSDEQWRFSPTTTNLTDPTTTLKDDFVVFPIPAKNSVTINYNNKETAQSSIVSVLNKIGMIVSQQKWQLVKGANSTNINTQQLASGTYYVNVYGTTSKQHKRVAIVVIK